MEVFTKDIWLPPASMPSRTHSLHQISPLTERSRTYTHPLFLSHSSFHFLSSPSLHLSHKYILYMYTRRTHTRGSYAARGTCDTCTGIRADVRARIRAYYIAMVIEKCFSLLPVRLHLKFKQIDSVYVRVERVFFFLISMHLTERMTKNTHLCIRAFTDHSPCNAQTAKISCSFVSETIYLSEK